LRRGGCVTISLNPSDARQAFVACEEGDSMRKAFTLVELLVALTIIAIVLAAVGPAIDGLLTNAQRNSVVQRLENMVGLAQSTARLLGTDVAIRVERGYQVDTDGLMVKDTLGAAEYEGYQQLRLVARGPRDGMANSIAALRAFHPVEGAGVVTLPQSYRVAPDYVLEASFDPDAANQLWQPSDGDAAPFNRIDTFYIVFNHRGELVRRTANELIYGDPTQPGVYVDHPDPSARSVVLYDSYLRDTTFLDIAELADESAVHINRYLGEVTVVD
jgi:prepilin-type N-terminal cleavage/methylation domain-containing protein